MSATIPPSLALYMDKTTGDFTIESYAVDPEFGACVSCGDLERISADKLRNDCVEILMANLDGFAARERTEQPEIERWSPSEVSKFEATNLHISVRFDRKASHLTLQPMHRDKEAGFVGCPEDRIQVVYPCSNDELWEQLMVAFEESD